jgi:hypothetical protein
LVTEVSVISTRNLSQLPDVDGLRRLLQSLAMLDAILCRDWQFRLYSFNARWAGGEQMGSMRTGQGEDFFALFNPHGCFLKGFAHEAEMTPYRSDPKRVWPGVLESVPQEFAACLREPAFAIEDTTFCIWRRYGDASWQRGKIEFPPGPDPDGSEFLLSPLDGRPETYREQAAWYFNKPFLTVETVRHIYEHRPLTDELVAALTPHIVIEEENPHMGVADLEDETTEIGYPT